MNRKTKTQPQSTYDVTLVGKTTKKLTKFGLLAALSAILAGSQAMAASSLGVNFAGRDPGFSMASTNTAGVVPQANWNNVSGDIFTGTTSLLLDDAGSLTEVTLDFQCNDSWHSDGPSGTPDEKLMKGCIKANPDPDTAPTNNTDKMVFKVKGLGAGPYDVLVYTTANGTGAKMGLNVGTTTYYFEEQASFNGTFVVATSTDPNNYQSNVNYARFNGVAAAGDGSITITATKKIETPQVNDGIGVAGIQIVSASPFPAVTVTNGLVAYWSFNGNLLDAVKGFHGTARGTAPIPFVDGVTNLGKAIKLDGTDQFVEITGGNENELEFPGGSMSIAGWFKVDAFDTGWQALISKGEGNNYRVARRDPVNTIAYAGGAPEGPADSPEVNDGKWHHFVAVTDATGTNDYGYGTALYVDGAIYEINLTLPVLASSDFKLMIGENPGARNREWEGEIDEIAIWNRILTDSEVTNLYSGGLGRPLSAFLPPLPTGIFISGASQTTKSFVFTVNDADGLVVDPATAVLTIDGQLAATTFTKTGVITTFTHVQSPAWAAGSQHPYKIEVKDTGGRLVTQQATFTLPTAWFPPENLPSPAVTNQWALRWIFGGGVTIGDLPTCFGLIKSVGTAGFTNVAIDTISGAINYPEAGGFFGNGLPYPDVVINDPEWTGANDFILFAVGHIDIPEEGDYTFGVHSDDGFAFRIRGGEAISISGNGSLDPVDPEAVVHPNTTGDSNTRAVYHLKKGVFRVEWFFFERGGGDNGEFYAAKGAFRNDTDTDQWALVGDTNSVVQTFNKPGVDTNGWAAVSSDPGATPVIATLADGLDDLAATGGGLTNYDALNIGDPESNPGVAPFPKNTPAADDNFAVRATATLVVPVAGDYEIGFTSDDGGWMKMPGQTFTEILQNATGMSAIVAPDEVQCDVATGNSLTTVKVTLTAGNHPIEIGFFEIGGGAFVKGIGAQFGAPQLPTLIKGGAGTFQTAASIKLTDRPTSVTEPLKATITKSGNNVIIQWTPTGGTLETTSSLSGTPVWTDAGTANPATITIGNGPAYFRVRQ